MTREARKRYIELQEELLSEVGKLYTFLVHESTPAKLNWSHIGSAQYALELVRQVNQFYLSEETSGH